MNLASVIFLASFIACAMLGSEQVVNGQAASKSVWDGVFTAAQAERGRGFYLANCSECHGATLEGGEKQALKGDRFWADWQETTVDYMLGRISKNMPFSEDGSLAGTLGTPTYVDIVTHILNSNGFPAGPSEMTAASSVGVQNRQEGWSERAPLEQLRARHRLSCEGRGTRLEADDGLASRARVRESVARRQCASRRSRVLAEVRAHVARQVRRLSHVGPRDADR